MAGNVVERRSDGTPIVTIYRFGDKAALGQKVQCPVLSKKVNADELYLDPTKTTDCIDSIEKYFNNLADALENISVTLNKAVKTSQVRGSYATAFKKWSKKSHNQSENAKLMAKSLKAKYNADYFDFVSTMLSDRLTELENKINTMSE